MDLGGCNGLDPRLTAKSKPLKSQAKKAMAPAFEFSEFLLNSFEQIKKCFTVQLRMQCNECVSFVLLLVSTMKNGGPYFENSL